MMPVRLSVTAVHWRIIANLRFKFQSHFTRIGRRAAGGCCAACSRCAAGESSRAMLTNARVSCCQLKLITSYFFYIRLLLTGADNLF